MSVLMAAVRWWAGMVKKTVRWWGEDGAWGWQWRQQGLAGDGLSFHGRGLVSPLACFQPQAAEIWGAGLLAGGPGRVGEPYHQQQGSTASLRALRSWFTCRHGSVQSKCKPHASVSLYMRLKAHSTLIKGLSLQVWLTSARQKSVKIDEPFFLWRSARPTLCWTLKSSAGTRAVKHLE